jgi:hypothetical protein
MPTNGRTPSTDDHLGTCLPKGRFYMTIKNSLCGRRGALKMNTGIADKPFLIFSQRLPSNPHR